MKKFLGYFFIEFLSEIRQKETIIWSFMFPLLLFFILNLTVGGAINQEENGITFRYVFIGGDTIYDKFIEGMFTKIPVFKEKPAKDIKEGMLYLKKGTVDVIIVSNNKNIDIYYTKERKASEFAKKVVEGIFDKLNLTISLTLQYIKYYSLKNFVFGAFGVDISPFIKKLKPITYKIEGISPGDKKFSYKDYLFPGLLLMSLISLGAFNIPLKITLYRETGILKKFFVTPLTPSILFFGNLITSFFIATIQYIIFALFSKYVMKVGINVFSPFIILYALLAFLLSYSIGFAIATLAKTPQTASILGNAVFFPLQFLGGLYFSVDNAPWAIKWFVLINPLTYISSSIRDKAGLIPSPYPLYLSYVVPFIWIGVLSIFVIHKFSWLGEKE